MAPDPVVWHEVGGAIRDAVPLWLVPAFLVITYLGNVGVFLTLFALDYWFRDRARGAHALGLAIGGIALVTALKAFFAEPRPPDEINVIPISGYAFPSGHATTSTIAYGVLAFDLTVGSKRVRYAAAALLIGLIALSRVVLGVHFLRDVVAGVIIGAAFLAVMILVTKHDPRPGFFIAAGIGAVALVLSGASQDGVAVFGATLGALLAWELLDRPPGVESTRNRLVLLGVVLPALAVLGYVSTLSTIPLLVVFVISAGLMAGILASPLLVTKLP